MVEIEISSGRNVTGFPITTLVGVPNSTVLISILTGLLLESLFAKKRSTAVKNAPFSSSFVPSGDGASILPPTLNDCASGSTYL